MSVALKVVMQNDRDFVDVLLLYAPSPFHSHSFNHITEEEFKL